MHGVLLGQGLGLASHLGTPPSLFSSQGANGGSERCILCPKETLEKTETQRRRGEFPSSHRMLFTLKDSRQAEGVGDRGWGCRRGSPQSRRAPRGQAGLAVGVGGDRHSSVAPWAKIAQREVGSFHMNKACL